jgi:hypothetical protein
MARANWLKVDPDMTNAGQLLDDWTNDPLWARRHAEGVAKVQLFGRWPVVVALSEELNRSPSQSISSSLKDPRRGVSPVGADRVGAGRRPGRGSTPPKPLGRP